MKIILNISYPLLYKYQPELDVTKELEDNPAKFYESMIGSLCWLVDVGWLDVTTEVSQLSLFSVNPHYGHMLTLLHLFGYLQEHHPARLLLGPTPPIFEGATKPNAD